jgi:branched-chain amino acid transport system permease protein
MNRTRRSAGWLVGLAALAVFPLVFQNPAITSIAVFTLIFMASSTSWNMFSGYSGYIALGDGVFFGAGAYTMALVSTHLQMQGGYSMFALVPLAGVLAMAVAVPVGMIALRVRRHTFVVITIAIFFVFQLAVINLSFTGGTAGIQMPSPTWSAAVYNVPFYYVGLAVVVVATLLSIGVRRSRFGLQLLAIRDDEDRALGLGVKVTAVKLTGFVMSAFCIGMAGALYADFLGQIYPQFAFDPLFDVSIALMAFLGGLGTVLGPLLGALILESLQQWLTLQFSSGSLYLIIYGVLFLVIILFMPQGIVTYFRQWWAKRSVTREATALEDNKVTGVIGASRA